LYLRRPPRSTPFPYTTLFRSQPGLRGLKPEQRELVLRRVAAGDPPSAIRYADTHTPADLGARELGMVTDVCRQSLRGGGRGMPRSEEHTSELQSRENLVCRLL